MRRVFDNYNLISALHSYFSIKDKAYQNLIPPLRILNHDEKKTFIKNLDDLKFSTNNLLVA